MSTVVVFTKNNARVLHNPANIDELRAHPNCVVDPDLSRVKRLPPHFWKLDGGHIVPMTPMEQVAVLDHHDLYGVDNEHPHPKTLVFPQQMKRNKIMHRVRLGLAVAAGGGLMELAHLIAHHI